MAWVVWVSQGSMDFKPVVHSTASLLDRSLSRKKQRVGLGAIIHYLFDKRNNLLHVICSTAATYVTSNCTYVSSINEPLLECMA